MPWNTHGLRGSAFEETINFTNEVYMRHELAVIQKISTPITPIEVNNKERIITKAYFGEKSTVDYIGVVQGIAVCFDAKETSYKNFPLKNIHQHQLHFMQAFTAQDGIAFLLINFKVFSQVFFVPYQKLKTHYETAQANNRKSIPHAHFDPKFIVKKSAGYPVHYLETLNIWLQQ
ncbi:MAG: Holliday junction resolvase RecU [Defluviitaleaceae bacterium]|nr:Holliday junction resolvase RecU [Defluviitaleaceae bacterium]